MFKHLWQKFTPNPLEVLLKKARSAGHKRFLIAWNRGLGDIPLGLYALTTRIKHYIPDASVTFLTRPDLQEGFSYLSGVEVLIAPHWKRGTPYSISSTLSELGVSPSSFDVVLEKPDPTRWVKWQLGTLVPKLHWNPALDALSTRFSLPANCIGVHVHTETTYGYEKNWSASRWSELFDELSSQNRSILLFGFQPTPLFTQKGIIDLRGKTTLSEMLSIIKNQCTQLVLPDSGILAFSYYLDLSFPLKIVSLWADPRQGVLKQNVSSPNPQLLHIPLIGPGEVLSAISAQDVLHALA